MMDRLCIGLTMLCCMNDVLVCHILCMMLFQIQRIYTDVEIEACKVMSISTSSWVGYWFVDVTRIIDVYIPLVHF